MFDALIMFELLKFEFFLLLSSAVGEKNVRGSNSSPADVHLDRQSKEHSRSYQVAFQVHCMDIHHGSWRCVLLHPLNFS